MQVDQHQQGRGAFIGDITSSNDVKNQEKMHIFRFLYSILRSSEIKLKQDFLPEAGGGDDFFKNARRLHAKFGTVVKDGLCTAEMGLVRVVRDEGGHYPIVYEVRSSPFCARPYYIYETAHFCKCPFFTRRVLEGKAFACEHLFAVLFAKACNLMKPDRVENANIMQNILTFISSPNEAVPQHQLEFDNMLSVSQNEYNQDQHDEVEEEFIEEI